MKFKGATLVVSMMVSLIIMISVSGVIFLVRNQANVIQLDIQKTKLFFITESGLNLGLTWLSAQKRINEKTMTVFPEGGGDKVYKIDGVEIKVRGKKIDGKWYFTAKANLDGKICEVQAMDIVPKHPKSVGNSLEFDGIDNTDGSRVKIRGSNHGLNLTDQITVMCWIKTAPAGTIGTGSDYKWSNIISNSNVNNAAAKCQFMLQQDSQNEFLEFALTNTKFNSDNRKYIVSACKMEPDKWYHVVATYDNSKMCLFVNGDYNNWSYMYDNPKLLPNNKYYIAYDQLTGINGYKTSLEASNNRAADSLIVENNNRSFSNFIGKGILTPSYGTYILNIGSAAGNTNNYGNPNYGGWRNFKGRIDDVSIWNRALSADEIKKYRIGDLEINGKEANLQAFWDFEGSAVDRLKNKKMIKDQQGRWTYDSSLDGVAIGKLTPCTNSGENKEDNNELKPIGALSYSWTVSY